MKNIILTMSGYSASSRKEENRIYEIIKNIAKKEKVDLKEGYNFNDISSVGVLAVNSALKSIKKMVENIGEDTSKINLFVIGKSMGGAKVYNLLKIKWSYLKNFNKIALMTIDAHGQILFDGLLKPFGKNQNLKWNKKWIKDTEKFRVYNIYQHKEWPHGASFNNAYLNLDITDEKNIDHFNIIKNNKVMKIIAKAFNFIK